MNLSFYGAAREVTGSCCSVEANGKKLLVDCGLQQGQDKKDDQKLPFNASGIDYVALTHAHIDHSGRLPLLVKEGFKGKIYAIEATCELIAIMLKDSAHIQEMDAKWENKRAKMAGKKEVLPMYNMKDVENTLELLVPCRYGEAKEIDKGIKISFVDAGHILGSAAIEVFLSEGEVSKKIVFSGDIGNTDQPIIKDPQCIREADYVVMESTYGDRDHEEDKDYTSELAGLIDKTLKKGGNVVIPSFAIGRTQGLLYLIREMKEKGLVKSSDFPVYVDSPMATRATDLYDDDLHIYGDQETKDIVKNGMNPLDFPNLEFTASVNESKALNYDTTPKVIIASSGMCEGGRIKHHLKHNLWKEDCAVVFVGYQARGTLGRELLDGAERVEIYRDEIAVLATIYNFTGLSAHADREGLLEWVNCFRRKPEKIFVVHGEESVTEAFVGTLEGLGHSAVAPGYEEVHELGSG
ncbi:MBL fold metallo-hydrolase RNA specificity domain-containing protein [Actinomycetota bacterium]